MPRDGAIIFGDLIGKLDVPRVVCDSCGRAGSYRVARLIEQYGRDAAISDWLDRRARVTGSEFRLGDFLFLR